MQTNISRIRHRVPSRIEDIGPPIWHHKHWQILTLDVCREPAVDDRHGTDLGLPRSTPFIHQVLCQVNISLSLSGYLHQSRWGSRRSLFFGHVLCNGFGRRVPFLKLLNKHLPVILLPPFLDFSLRQLNRANLTTNLQRWFNERVLKIHQIPQKCWYTFQWKPHIYPKKYPRQAFPHTQRFSKGGSGFVSKCSFGASSGNLGKSLAKFP